MSLGAHWLRRCGHLAGEDQRTELLRVRAHVTADMGRQPFAAILAADDRGLLMGLDQR